MEQEKCKPCHALFLQYIVMTSIQHMLALFLLICTTALLTQAWVILMWDLETLFSTTLTTAPLLPLLSPSPPPPPAGTPGKRGRRSKLVAAYLDLMWPLSSLLFSLWQVCYIFCFVINKTSVSKFVNFSRLARFLTFIISLLHDQWF